MATDRIGSFANVMIQPAIQGFLCLDKVIGNITFYVGYKPQLFNLKEDPYENNKPG